MGEPMRAYEAGQELLDVPVRMVPPMAGKKRSHLQATDGDTGGGNGSDGGGGGGGHGAGMCVDGCGLTTPVRK